MTEKKYLDYPGLQTYNNALKGVYATKDLATSENNGLMSSTDKNKLNNLNVVEMTQAEYNALSEAEKNNGTIYFITDAGGTGGGASSESIAPIEQSTTASQAYEVGDLLFYDDILYKVTTAISQGGTIIISGSSANVIQTDIDTELKNKIKVSSTVGLVKNDGTIDTNLYATTTQLAGKADKVANASIGHLAGLDANGNLTDSGVLATSISGKADKVVSATDDDLAKLNSYGNLVDSGISANNVVVKSSTAGLIKNDGSIDETSYATTAKAYLTDDTAETALDDADYVPFYDTSATAKRKTLWSNIKSVLKTYFDTVYKDINVHDDWEDVTNKPFENIAIGSSGLEVDSGGWLSALIRTVQLRHYNGVRQGDGTGFTQLWVNSQAASGNSIIEGTQFFQQKVTLSTSNPVQVTFEETEITTDKVIEVFAGRYNGDVSGEQNIFPYSNMYTTNGTCVITYPAFTSAIQILVRIYVK